MQTRHDGIRPESLTFTLASRVRQTITEAHVQMKQYMGKNSYRSNKELKK